MDASRSLRWAAAALTVAGALSAAGCGGQEGDASHVETFVRDHARPGLQLQSVSCPGGVSPAVGKAYSCKVVASGGIKGRLTLHITIIQGTTLGLRFGYTDFPPTPPVPPQPARVSSSDVAAAAVGTPAFT